MTAVGEAFVRSIVLLFLLLAVGLVATGVLSALSEDPIFLQDQSSEEDLIDDFLEAELPDEFPPTVKLPQWLDISIHAPEEPEIGHPFVVEVELRAAIVPLEGIRLEAHVPPGLEWTGELPQEAFSLPAGASRRFSLEVSISRPVSVTEGRVTLVARVPLPRAALHHWISEQRAEMKLDCDKASLLEKALEKTEVMAKAIQQSLVFCVRAEEGFVGFTPLVWGNYLPYRDETSFFIGAGSFLDVNFELQEQIQKAQKELSALRFKEAAACFEQVLNRLDLTVRRDPMLYFEAVNGLAVAQAALGNLKGARKLWLTLVENQGPLATPRLPLRYVHYNLGESYRLTGKLALARSAYERALEHKQHFPLVKQRLALLATQH